jgi:hypothetical protein
MIDLVDLAPANTACSIGTKMLALPPEGLMVPTNATRSSTQ